MEMILKLKRGRLEIPKQLQEELHLHEDDEIILTSAGDHFIMKIKHKEPSPEKNKTKTKTTVQIRTSEETETLWTAQMDYWRKNQQEIILNPKYQGKFVAISDFQIIGTAEDKFELYREMRKKYPEKYFVIVKAVAESELPKPRIESPLVRR